MAMSERLRQTREKLGLTLQQVADRVGLSAPTISAYETGQREPSFSHLAKFGKLYCRPVEFFLSEQAEPEEVVVWRTKPHSPKAEELEATLLELGQRYRELEVWADSVMPLRLPRYEDASDIPGMAAAIRKVLGLGDRPGASLEDALQDAGVKIFHLEFEPKTASASTVTAAFGAAILLNSLAHRRDRIYALAHELFHILTWGKFEKGNTEAEALADQFADCLLLPDEAVRHALTPHLRDGGVTFRALDLVALGFDVPLDAFLRRAGEVFGQPKDVIRQNVLRVQASGFSTKAEPRQTTPSRPRRFVELATKAYDDGKMSIGRLAEYLGISRQEAMKQFFHNGKENIGDEKVLLASS
jgi:transcriptional regulator with XRE-family HTH domain/Zn-dependent peptidase ImmA (M78 family)/predicted HTH domain antitoxin